MIHVYTLCVVQAANISERALCTIFQDIGELDDVSVTGTFGINFKFIQFVSEFGSFAIHQQFTCGQDQQMVSLCTATQADKKVWIS